MNKIECVWGINSQNRRGKYRKVSYLYLISLCFSGINLPNFLLDEEEKERDDLTKKQKLYTEAMR